MYEIDELDEVVELEDIPAPSSGAPLPAIVVNESKLLLAYRGNVHDPDWDGTYAKSVSAKSKGGVVWIRFDHAISHMFGSPNDETLFGHPLYKRGLRHYGAYEIKESSWIRNLERINSVHPGHSPALYEKCRHIIITFHDSTFECVADGYRVAERNGSMRSALLEMAKVIVDDTA